MFVRLVLLKSAAIMPQWMNFIRVVTEDQVNDLLWK